MACDHDTLLEMDQWAGASARDKRITAPWGSAPKHLTKADDEPLEQILAAGTHQAQTTPEVKKCPRVKPRNAGTDLR